MFRLFVEDGETVKAEHVPTGDMYANIYGTWQPVPGNIDQHARFHPYADIEEADTVDGMDEAAFLKAVQP
jgi:hypothetical protein